MRALAQAVLAFHVKWVKPHNADDTCGVDVPIETWLQWVELADPPVDYEKEASPAVAKAMGRFHAKLAEVESAKKYDLALIACSAAKALTEVGTSLPARDLYVGPTFKLALELAQREAREVRILSALHYMVRPEDPLKFYDHALPTSKRAHDRWADACRATIESDPAFRGLDRSLKVLILAPKAYAAVRHDWHHTSEWDWTWPFKGLAIGQQKAWLKKALAGQVTP